jgi:hypothetical protein
MITPQTNLPLDIMPFRQGLAWWVGDTSLSWMGTVIRHSGHTVANHTDLMWLPGAKLGVFVSVNTASPVGVEHQVAALALGLMVTAKTGPTAPAPAASSPPVQVSASTLDRAVGRYAYDHGIYLIKARDGALVWTGSHSLTMTPRADGWYASDTPGAPSMKVETVKGRRLLIGRTAGGAVGAVAERIPDTYHVPSAWRERVGQISSAHGVYLVAVTKSWDLRLR